jgi:hypothetical protein
MVDRGARTSTSYGRAYHFNPAGCNRYINSVHLWRAQKVLARSSRALAAYTDSPFIRLCLSAHSEAEDFSYYELESGGGNDGGEGLLDELDHLSLASSQGSSEEEEEDEDDL